MQGEGRNLRRRGPELARACRRALAAVALIYLLGGMAAVPALAAPDWLAPTDLSAAGEDALAPQVGIDASGDAVAVWARYAGSHTIVQSASRPAGGAWQQPVDLSAMGRDATEPQVAVDPAGNAVAVWARSDGSHTIVQSAWQPAGGAWQQPLDLSTAGQNAKAPQVAIDPAGNAVAVWARYSGTKFIIQSASRPAGGAWTPAVDLSAEGQNAEAPQVALDLAGDAVAAWARFDGSKSIIQSASRAAGGAWEIPHDLSATGASAETPQVALDPAGNAVAVWSRANGGLTSIIQAASRSAGGPWQPPVDLSSVGLVAAEEPQVAVDPAGNAVAVWTLSDGSPNVVQGATRSLGGPWQPRTILSVIGRNSTEPQLALDPAGDGLAVWSRDNGANTIAQGIGYDGAGPLLRAVSIPAAGTVHRPVSFSVSPFDVWSRIGPVAWSFGDGEGGDGTAATHTYSRTGVYQVKLTAADVLANSADATGTVRIYPKASASRNVRVRGGRALLRLRCPSPAGCEGALRLIAGIELERRHRRVGRRAQIGNAAFGIPGATTTTVPVPLTAKGIQLVRNARRIGVKAQLTGPGVKHRLVALLPPRR